MSPTHASQRLRDSINDHAHNLAQWSLQGIDPLGQTMFHWTDWPKHASEQLERAYQREHTRLTLQVNSRDIWNHWDVWARTRAKTLEDDDDDNDLTDDEERLTFLIDLETDHGEYFEATTQLNVFGKGGGPCHSYRVKRTPRGMNGELLGGNIMKQHNEIPENNENQDASSVDRSGLIYGKKLIKPTLPDSISPFD